MVMRNGRQDEDTTRHHLHQDIRNSRVVRLNSGAGIKKVLPWRAQRVCAWACLEGGGEEDGTTRNAAGMCTDPTEITAHMACSA
jgi:hypothetical protein